ncbi:MAG: 2'-5' RNA ligase family protein [Proteobacteria bacterium]|nr:2'-5' RNA ligase family protein [Pseudomonadota bacterium]
MALWLIPEPTFLAPFHSVIRELSVTLGGPVFTPHVTLLSRITGTLSSATGLTAHLARMMPSFEVSISRVAHSAEASRAVFLELSYAGGLRDARKDAESLFPHHAPTPFSPHLSLPYGDVDQAQAEAACLSIMDRVPRRFVVGALELIRASSASRVQTWRRLRTFTLEDARSGE